MLRRASFCCARFRWALTFHPHAETSVNDRQARSSAARWRLVPIRRAACSHSPCHQAKQAQWEDAEGVQRRRESQRYATLDKRLFCLPIHESLLTFLRLSGGGPGSGSRMERTGRNVPGSSNADAAAASTGTLAGRGPDVPNRRADSLFSSGLFASAAQRASILAMRVGDWNPLRRPSIASGVKRMKRCCRAECIARQTSPCSRFLMSAGAQSSLRGSDQRASRSRRIALKSI